MSHKVESMAYAGQTPWHGLGKKVTGVMTTEEAIVAAGLDWTVSKAPLFRRSKEGVLTAIDDGFSVTRDDNGKHLGVVGAQHTNLSNRKRFALLDRFLGSNAGAPVIDTAGSLDEGRIVFLSAKLEGVVRVKGDDILEKYFLLADDLIGRMKLTGMFTPVRVVCWNTLSMALSGGEKQAKVRHTRNIAVNASKMADILGMVSKQYDILGEAAGVLAAKSITVKGVGEYFKDLIAGDKDADEKKLSTRTLNILADLTKGFEYGKGANLPSARGTLWGAYNAVTEYVDHTRSSRGGDDMVAARTQSALFGSGADLKQEAWDKALILAR